MVEGKDYVKNLSNEEMLQKDVFDKKEWEVKKLTAETEKAINDKVESSFQNFLSSTNLDNMSDTQKQVYFNTWLDTDVNKILDAEKINEIKWVNWEIEKSLKNLEFTVQLSELETAVHEQRDRESQTVTLSTWITIEWMISNQVTTEQLNWLINTINTTNFKEKEYIVECLNSGTKEDIRKIQYLLIWKKDNYKAWQWWNREWDLSRFWTDWLFWRETFDALTKYINNPSNKIESQPANAGERREWWDWVEWAPVVDNQTVDNTVRVDNPVVTEWTRVDNSGNSLENWEFIIENIDINVSEIDISNIWDFDENWDFAFNEWVEKPDNNGKYIEINWKKIYELWNNQDWLYYHNDVLNKSFYVSQYKNWKMDWTWLLAMYNGDKYTWYRKNWVMEGEGVYSYADWSKIEWVFHDNYILDWQRLDKDWKVVQIWENWVEREPRASDLTQNNGLYVQEGQDLNLLNSQLEDLSQLTEEQAKKIVEISKNTIMLNKLEKMDEATARILSNFEWEISLNGLKELDTNVLQIFAAWKCTRVYFPRWILIKDGWTFTIDCGETGKYNTINDDVCNALLKTGGYYNANISEIVVEEDRLSWTPIVENWSRTSGNDDYMEQEIQYDAEWYNVEAPKKQVDNDEDAIKYLTVWKSVFFVAKWFGKSWYNEELSIVDWNYEPKDQEKKDLKTLRKWLESCIKWGSTPAEIFSKIIAWETNFDWNKKLQRLAKLYKEYKADQNGNKKWAYFKKVMWLLENYYVRWVNPKWTDWSFKDMYNNELIWVNEDLITKEKKAWLNQDQMNQINEWWWDAVNGANTINRMKLSSNEFSKFREKYWFSSDAETQFAMCLCDLNADWRIDSRDMDVKTGQEMFNIFRDAKVDQKYWLIEKWPMQNILNFAKLKARQDWYANTATFLEWIKLNGTDEEIMNQLKARPLTMQYLRLMLSQSPMDAVNNIMKYGSVDTKLDVVTDAVNDLWSDAADEMIAELMVSPEFEEVFENWYQDLIKQWLSDSPEVKQALRPIIAASLLEDGWAFGGWISAGLDWNLWKAGDIAFTLWYWKTPDWQDMLGIWVSYGKSWRLWKRNWVILSAWATWWLWTNFDSFIPMWIGEVWAAFLLNGKKLENTLDLRWAKYLWINGNAGWVWAPARWVSLSYMNDKMQWLTNTYESIKGDLASTLEWVVDWTKIKDKDACIAGIKTKLEKRFEKSDDETIQKAAERIYSWLSYYTVWFEDLNTLDEKTKKRIIESVAENYALQWRNQAINELEWDVHFQRAAIWVEFIAWFWPLPMASISLEWYKNKYVHETQESMENYYRQLASGKDMRLHNEFMSDNGEITQEWINYLNDKLSIANPNLNTPDMKLSLLSLWVDGVKKSIVIPKDLYKYVNIHVNPALKDFIKKDTDWNFVVPSNIPVSLLTYSRTGTWKFDLMIWSKNATANDIMLSANSEFSGNPENFEWLKWEISKDDVNNSVLVQWDEFPMISNCESVDESTIVLNMLPWVKVNVAASDPNIQVLVDPTSWATLLEAPKYGKLIFTKQWNGEYNVSFEQPSDGSKQLVVEYKDQWNAISETVDVNFTDEAIDALFTDLEVKLSAMDWAQRDWNYVAFMNAAAELWVDNILDGNDYDNAFDALKKILNWKLNTPEFEALKTYMESENITPVAKILIVDRFKAIFSYNDKLVNPYNLWLQLAHRWNVYKQLKWYDQSVDFPLTSDFDYRSMVQSSLNELPTFKRELIPDLVWMTAFYRLWNKNAWRSYMMTELWWTSVLWSAARPIETADLNATKEWFLANLDKSWVHKELLKNSLLIQINDKLPEWDRISEMSDDTLKAILNWWENIDIWWKNIKISCNPTYMFYLLWECANESIWVRLWKISISRAWSEAHSVTIDWTQRWLYSNWVEAQNRFDLWRRGWVTLWVMVGNKKQEEPTPPNQWTWNNDTPPDPNQWTWHEGGGNQWTWHTPDQVKWYRSENRAISNDIIS